MLYFINPESDRNLDDRPLADIASSTIFKVHPDGLCVSADAAGADVDSTLIASVKRRNPEVAVLVNTGCRPDTIRDKLSVSDAAIVGTYFKEGGRLEDDDLNNVRVSVNRVKELMMGWTACVSALEKAIAAIAVPARSPRMIGEFQGRVDPPSEMANVSVESAAASARVPRTSNEPFS